METAFEWSPELTRLAQQALEASRGDRDAAVAALRVQVGKNRELYLEFVEPILKRALRYIIDEVEHEDVQPERAEDVPPDANSTPSETQTHACAVAQAPRRTSAPSALLVAGLAAITRRNLLTFELSNGLRLGDATADDLLREAVASELYAAAKVREARWLKAIASRLADRRAPVREQMTHHDLERLLHESVTDAAPVAPIEVAR